MKNEKRTCEKCGKDVEINQIKKHIRYYHNELSLDITKMTEYILENFYGCKNVDGIIKEYVSGISCDELVKRYNMSKQLFKELLKLKNIPNRGVKEANNQVSTKDKVKKYFVKKFGVDNPSKLNEIKQKKIDTHYKNFGNVNNFCIKKILTKAQKCLKEKHLSTEFVDAMKSKYKATLKRKYGEDISNVAQIDSVRKQISLTHKKNCSKMSKDEKFQMTKEARKNIRNLKTSKIELQIQEGLNLLGIRYVKNEPVSPYNCDIVIGGKIIIEVQGDLFHANPKIYKNTDFIPVVNKLASEIWESDKTKREFLEKKGYKVIYIWEKEVRRKPIHKIIELLEKCLEIC